MTQKMNRIEYALVPLELFSRRLPEDETMVSGSPLQLDDNTATMMPSGGQSAPVISSEAQLMRFSVTPDPWIVPLTGQASPASTPDFTLYVVGTLFELFCYSIQLDRLLDAAEEEELEEEEFVVVNEKKYYH